MTALPNDLALTLSRFGIPVNAPDEQLDWALRVAIADRGGYFDGPTVGFIGWTVELLAPARETFEGRTAEIALAWCLVWMLGETGEIGVSA